MTFFSGSFCFPENARCNPSASAPYQENTCWNPYPMGILARATICEDAKCNQFIIILGAPPGPLDFPGEIRIGTCTRQ